MFFKTRKTISKTYGVAAAEIEYYEDIMKRMATAVGGKIVMYNSSESSYWRLRESTNIKIWVSIVISNSDKSPFAVTGPAVEYNANPYMAFLNSYCKNAVNGNNYLSMTRRYPPLAKCQSVQEIDLYLAIAGF